MTKKVIYQWNNTFVVRVFINTVDADNFILKWQVLVKIHF